MTGVGQITDGKHHGVQVKNYRIDGAVPLGTEIRKEIFGLYGKRVRAARFLDLCAGTGMIGIEAISRGASLCSFVERKAKRCKIIRENLRLLGIKPGHGEVFEEEASGFLKKMAGKRRFWDNVFFDPPFDADYDDAFRFFGNGSIIRPGGSLAIRHHSAMFFPERVGVLKRRSVANFEEESLSVFDRMA